MIRIKPEAPSKEIIKLFNPNPIFIICIAIVLVMA